MTEKWLPYMWVETTLDDGTCARVFEFVRPHVADEVANILIDGNWKSIAFDVATIAREHAVSVIYVDAEGVGSSIVHHISEFVDVPVLPTSRAAGNG